jgi:hypothetical protein
MPTYRKPALNPLHDVGHLQFLRSADDNDCMRFNREDQDVTLAAAAYTDSTVTFPAGSIAIGVSGEVDTVIPTASTFKIGVAGQDELFLTGIAVAAGTTFKAASVNVFQSATAIRITPSSSPGAATGVVRIVLWYLELGVGAW